MRKNRLNQLASLLGFTTPFARFADEEKPDTTGSDANDKGTGGGSAKDGEVRLTKEEYAELTAAKASAASLSKDKETGDRRWAAMQKVLRGDLPASDKAEAMKTLLTDAGYNQKQIDAYIKTQFGADDDEDETPAPRNRRGKAAEEDEDDLAEIRANQQQIIEQQRQMRVRELQGILETETTKAFTAKDHLGGVLKVLKDAYKDAEGDDASSINETMESIKQEFKDRVTTALQVRRNATGKFDDSWFAEEAVKASKDLAKKYKPLVISYPSRLGRAEATEGGEDFFLPDKPLELPKSSDKLSPEQVKSKVNDWAADKLLRSLKGSGGESRV